MYVSVVTAVYNGEEYLHDAIMSILHQTYDHFEYIIVNDGSNDRTKEILNGVDDERVKVYHMENNRGAAACLNFAISKAKGDWIAIQDADDISYLTRIEDQVSYVLQHSQISAVASLMEAFDGRGIMSVEDLQKEEGYNAHLTKEEIREHLYYGNPICHGTMMFSKKMFQKAGGYNPQLKIAYDLDLWFKLLERGPIEKLPKILYRYRIDHESLSRKDWGETCLETVGIKLFYIKQNIFSLLIQPTAILIGSKRAISKMEPCFVDLNFRISAIHNIKTFQRSVGIRRKSRIDADVIFVLEDYKYARSIISNFVQQGYKLNENLFIFWNVFK